MRQSISPRRDHKGPYPSVYKAIVSYENIEDIYGLNFVVKLIPTQSKLVSFEIKRYPDMCAATHPMMLNTGTSEYSLIKPHKYLQFPCSEIKNKSGCKLGCKQIRGWSYCFKVLCLGYFKNSTCELFHGTCIFV